MGIGQSKMCSCNNYDDDEEKKNTEYKNIDYQNEESMKFTEMLDSKIKTGEFTESKVINSVFSSRNNRDFVFLWLIIHVF